MFNFIRETKELGAENKTAKDTAGSKHKATAQTQGRASQEQTDFRIGKFHLSDFKS